ncbi:MAG TPA: hypothetical protein VEV83_11670, partial [Parafilimonas sp.]|nr:hypothetical protein [Parafilimonas sp.]
MKKTLLIFAAILTVTASFAQTKHKIKVSNFQFSPATTNAVVGDIIIFVWVSGTHTTTSTSVPVGAKPWDTAMDINHPKFKYKIKVAGTYNFHCNIHPLSMTGKIIVSSPLDAAMGTFALNWENAKAVLTWNTDKATDASYFSIQRSLDGSNFTEIAKVQPTSSNNYKYTDQTSAPSKYVYYQLQLVQKSGNTQLSDIKMLTNPGAVSKLITSISPNPISSPGHLMLQFNADKEGKMLVQLYNSAGELVKQT